MPLYEYKCEKCGEQFDVRQCYGEDGSKLKCPRCGEPNPRKQITGFAPQGSGGSTESGQACYIPRRGG
jgi:putative FmdB family regulatory protein